MPPLLNHLPQTEVPATQKTLADWGAVGPFLGRCGHPLVESLVTDRSPCSTRDLIISNIYIYIYIYSRLGCCGPPPWGVVGTPPTCGSAVSEYDPKGTLALHRNPIHASRAHFARYGGCSEAMIWKHCLFLILPWSTNRFRTNTIAFLLHDSFDSYCDHDPNLISKN